MTPSQNRCCPECYLNKNGAIKGGKCFCSCHVAKSCCAFCKEGGDYQIRRCKDCSCHSTREAVKAAEKALETHNQTFKRLAAYDKGDTPSPSSTEWEEHFDKIWYRAEIPDFAQDTRFVLKSFISSLLREKEDEIRGRERERIFFLLKETRDAAPERGWGNEKFLDALLKSIKSLGASPATKGE